MYLCFIPHSGLGIPQQRIKQQPPHRYAYTWPHGHGYSYQCRCYRYCIFAADSNRQVRMWKIKFQ